ncbi:hypothetical protein XENTR_v10021012 [Xenopus tropicalis]|nr:hypothetical protein XENTR_v10021012 [Xenopus tropicalis]
MEYSAVKLREWLMRSVKQKTWSAYVKIWRTWSEFKKNTAGNDVDVLLLFMFQHIEAKHSPAYIRKQLAGISFFLRLFRLPDVTKMAVVRQVQKGFSRELSLKDHRKPITLPILQKLVGCLSVVCSDKYEATLFKFLFILMFFAALRVSEAVSQSKREAGGLDLADVVLVKNRLKISIKSSKTDISRKGVTLWIGNFQQPNLCPVKAFLEFLKVRPKIPGPLFVHNNGTPVSIFQMQRVLQLGIAKVGLPACHYKSHSFRIGAATQASLLGLGENFIKRLGRWQSNRYLSYVRPNLVDVL